MLILGDICKDCTCQPPFPPGCDCDPAADDPNASCSAGNECVQCKCLPLGKSYTAIFNIKFFVR